MYPSKELKALAIQKDLLVAHQALLRARCRLAARTVAEPLSWVDTAKTVWKRMSPLLGVSSVLLSRGKALRGAGLVGLAVKWAPRAFELWKTMRSRPSRANPAMAAGTAPVVVRASLSRESPVARYTATAR
jgi:hypothetical protein